MQIATKRPINRILYNQEWLVIIALSLLVFLLRLPSLEQPFDNDSGSFAYYARLIVRGEPLYSTHHPGAYLPAVYYTYALAFLLFGDSVWAVKFLLLLWSIITTYLLYRLGNLLVGRVTGLLATGFYAILTSHIWMLGATAETELFANLPRIAAVLVLLHLTIREAAPWKFVFVGLLGSIAFLYKAVYLSPLAMAGFIILVELWQNRSVAGVWRTTIKRGLWILIGFLAGLLSVVTYFGLIGLLPRLLLVFSLGREYVRFRNTTAAVGPQYWLIYPLFGLAINNAVLLIFSLIGLLVTVIKKFRRFPLGLNEKSTAIFYIAVWYILSFVEAGITRTLFLHYYLLIIPPLSLLAIWILLKIYHQVRARRRFIATLFLILSITLILLISIGENFNYYYHYVRYRFGPETYRDFLVEGWPHVGSQLIQLQELADYIRERTSPDDRLYYWSGAVQLYYLADRRCSLEMIFPIYAEAQGPPQRIFAPHTKYVIVGESNSRPRPDWLYPELANNYILEEIMGGQEIFRRMDSNE